MIRQKRCCPDCDVEVDAEKICWLCGAVTEIGSLADWRAKQRLRTV